MRVFVAVLAVGLAVFVASCVPEFAPASQLGDSPQVLAVRVNPPAVAPGDTVRLDALLHWPGDAPEYLWLVCVPTAADTIDTCVANRLGDGGVLLPLCASAPGAPLCYASRDATALYTVPGDVDAPDGGASIFVELVVGDDVDSQECARAYRDLNPAARCLVAVKRLAVSGSVEAAHRNPALLPLEVDGLPVDATSLVALDPTGAQGEDLAVNLTVGVVPETVDELLGDEPPDEVRLPVAWYATCGGFGEDEGSLVCQLPAAGEIAPTCELLEVEWQPAASGECTVHVTVRDGRGGVVWITQQFVVGAGG